MSQCKAYVVLAALLIAGCASSPEVADEASTPATAVAASSTAQAASSGTVVPNTIVDANELIANTPAPPICREVLRPNSNVHERRCMSAEHWKLWDQAEAQRAAQIVRMMQGSPYR
jgi:PBP1b-binding outer membrane lipoprotein LpoB